MIEMTVDSVRENQETHRKVALLKETTQERYLCIQVADDNAYALASALHGIPEPRPLTHDLLINIINGLGAHVERVVVSDVADDVFYARIDLAVGGEHIEFDARPSDAFALAVRAKSPIFAEEWILEQSGFIQEISEMSTEPDEPADASPQ
jgi:uncharacterized protein